MRRSAAAHPRRSSTSAPTRATSSTLDAGAQLVVTQQNLDHIVDGGARAPRAKRVRLIWKRPARTHSRWRRRSTRGHPGGPDDAQDSTRRLAAPGRRLAPGRVLAAASERRRRGGQPRPTPLPTDARRRRGRLTILPGRATSRTARRIRAYDWVTPFEQATGCQVDVQVLRDVGRGVQHVRRTRASTTSSRPRVTPASASSAAGYVQPVNTDLVHELRRHLRRPQGPAVQHGRRGALRRPPRPRRQPAACGAPTRSIRRPTRWSDDVRPDLAARRARSPSTTHPSTSPMRRVVLMTTRPDLGITNPYALDETQFDGGGRAAQGSSSPPSASTGPTTLCR